MSAPSKIPTPPGSTGIGFYGKLTDDGKYIATIGVIYKRQLLLEPSVVSGSGEAQVVGESKDAPLGAK